MKLLEFSDLKLAKGIPYTRTHLWRLWKAGKFPRPIRVGDNRNAWIDTEIDNWIESRVASRDREIATT